MLGQYGLAKIFQDKNISSLSSLGQFGDSFGALTALFSGLGLIGIYWTIYLQKTELSAAKDAFLGQHETLKIQRFETTFFNMLSQHNELVRSLRQNAGNGKAAIAYIFYSLESDLMSGNGNEICPDVVNMEYDQLYKNYGSDLGCYYRSLYRLFKFLDESNIDSKKEYADIIRSQLTDDEISLLFFNGMSHKGSNFKKYIEEYALLNNINFTDLILKLQGFYASKAFQ